MGIVKPVVLMVVALCASFDARSTEPAGDQMAAANADRGVAEGENSGRALRPGAHAEVLLPASLRWASDVRWDGDSRLVVAAGKAGVVAVDTSGNVTESVIPGGVGKGSLWFASRVGVSKELVVGAAPFHNVVMQRRALIPDERNLEYAAVLDLDVSGSLMLVLGARRDDAGRWSPDGATAWLDDGGSDPRPVQYLSRGVTRDAVGRCGINDIGAVKILRDGSFVVVPGVDEGVFWYAADGTLRWNTQEGLADDEARALWRLLAERRGEVRVCGTSRA